MPTENRNTENRKQHRARKAVEQKLGKKAFSVIYAFPADTSATYKGHKREKSHHWGDRWKG